MGTEEGISEEKKEGVKKRGRMGKEEEREGVIREEGRVRKRRQG